MKYFTILSLIFILLRVNAQECGLTTGDMPISTYNITDDYNYAWSASLFDSYQVGGTQTITKICVSINSSGGGSSTLSGQKIWMRMTSTSSYSSCSHPGTSGFTKVYDGNITYPSSGFININLSTSFNYNDDTKYLEVLWENTNSYDDNVQDWSFDRLDANSNYVGKWGSSQSSFSSAKSNCQRIKYTEAIGFNETNSVNCGLLPIKLKEFTIKKDSKNIELTWITASETNNDFFTIERSMDGVNFTEIDKVNGAGNSNKQLKYSCIDKGANYGVNYYRLKQTDFDGSYTYSKIQAVNFDKSNIIEVSIYPNPVIGELLNIETNNENLLVTIYNCIGEKMEIKRINNNGNKHIIDVSDLPKGMYFIETKIGDESRYNKVLIK